MTLTTVVMVGRDKLGAILGGMLPVREHLHLWCDGSTDWRRVVRLWRRGVLPPGAIARMGYAEWQRPAVPMPRCVVIRDNKQFLSMLNELDAQCIFLFRAGLVINSSVLETGIKILNVHCARLPDYNGLNAIGRALANADYSQCATLHRVTRVIDTGEVIATEPYQLDPSRPYRVNEDVAYRAGMRLLLRAVNTRLEP